jgi:hypothetical protein
MLNKNVNWMTAVAGTGHWTTFTGLVKVIKVEVCYVNDEGDFGELRAYFDSKSWDVHAQGLIYTDPQWITELRAMMKTLGFSRGAVEDITYSEQGMQGDNYVSMDIGEYFLRECEPLYRFVINRQMVNSELA